MNGVERIIISYPNNTTVDIQGDPAVVKQLIEFLDSIEITYTKVGFKTKVATK